ncbi:MAG: hypothetical protein NC092_01090 [Butyrivibrio sp.]|nr:hypothetical protein [Muribaculum sp.]MCM1551267.1 hypothetical protein [Butyrivibrio sp.]
MQIGGVGSGLDSHSSSHQVTNCIHKHETSKNLQGGMKLSSSETPTAQTAVELTMEPLSLADVARRLVNAGRNLWGRIWGESAPQVREDVTSSKGEVAAEKEQVMAQVGDVDVAERHAPQIAAASGAIPAPQMTVQSNPYFTTTSDTGVIKENIFKKLRVKFRDAAEQLNKRFGGRLSGSLSGRSSLKEHRKQPKEDLRKHSRYREDGLELDCVLTDDSYLMDSYDRKGEYTTLTTKK